MKHKNFGVFYNHLFKQRMGETSIKQEPKSEDDENEIAGDKDLKKKDENRRQKHYRTQRDLSESPERHVQEKTRIPRHSSPSSSDSEVAEKVESYRDRREQYNAMERSREIEREKRKHKDQTSERSRERRRSRERHYGRERTSNQERKQRGRHRSVSSDRKRRHSRSRTPTSQRVGTSDRGDRRDRRAHRSSPSTSKLDSPRRTIKKERLSSDRDSKESKPNTNDKKNKKDNPSDGKAPNVDGVKVKKESEQDEKEKRQDRIRKLFTKRTVGEKFDEALQRYYQRKAEREAQG